MDPVQYRFARYRRGAERRPRLSFRGWVVASYAGLVIAAWIGFLIWVLL